MAESRVNLLGGQDSDLHTCRSQNNVTCKTEQKLGCISRCAVRLGTGVLTIDFLPFPPNLVEHLVAMLLENMQVANTGLDELRPDQLPAVVPGLAIGSEDAMDISLTSFRTRD